MAYLDSKTGRVISVSQGGGIKGGIRRLGASRPQGNEGRGDTRQRLRSSLGNLRNRLHERIKKTIRNKGRGEEE